MSEYEPREFAIKGTLHAPESVGAEQLAESLKRGLEQSRLGATVDLGDFTKYAEDEGGCPCDRCGKHHPATTCAEHVGKDDLYVEPEPLKEGDWVQVWAQVNRLADDDGDLLLVSRAYGEAAMTSRKFYTRSDAIVRPDAGQVPPWVKPARCTSLRHIADDNVYVRCVEDSDHSSDHGAGYMGGRVNWSGAGDASAVQGGAS